jgi:capsular polysaccharide transport system permease protein
MASEPLHDIHSQSPLARAFSVQLKVIGALILRELHTRYGRDNIGYLWVIGEPLTLASAIALIHAGQPSHYGSDMRAVPFAVLGYCVFIMFRGIFNRAEGTVESNAPLMYHKMVTIFDMMISRALLEGAGVFLSLLILMTLMVAFGLSTPPARPLYLIAGIFAMLFFSFGLSLIVVSVTHDNRLLGRLVHPLSYLMLPVSGAFIRMEWLPEYYRWWLSWVPFTHIFELCRYGMFESGTLEYVSFIYLVGSCLVTLYIGLVAITLVRKTIHLS